MGDTPRQGDWTKPAAMAMPEYGEYPYVTADEIKKALRIKAHLSGMLDQMQ